MRTERSERRVNRNGVTARAPSAQLDVHSVIIAQSLALSQPSVLMPQSWLLGPQSFPFVSVLSPQHSVLVLMRCQGPSAAL